MSDLDKDIERCKELIKTEHSNWIGMTNQDAISNVLSELEKEREGRDILSKLNKEIFEELETWKKIAEKLTLTILEIDVEEKDVYETICKSTPNNRCEEFGNGNCTQCIIDWARKEVSNDKQS